MSPLSASELQALGVEPMSPAARAAHRAGGVLHHLVALVALGRDRGLAAAELAEWILAQAEERGYYAEWIGRHGAGNVDAYLKDFLGGRAMLYDESIVERVPGGYDVITRIWYHDEVPESFFYHDVSQEEFSEYVACLARANARRCGIDVILEHADGREIARIRRG
jgi:hypothetical protein